MPETTRNLSTFPQPFIHKNPACIVFQSFLSETTYLNGYAAVGYSGSSVFTEGTCDTNYSGAFVSYIDSGTLAIINLIKSTSQLFVYPNPAQNTVDVFIPYNGVANLNIINSMGQIVFTKEINQQTEYINIDVRNWNDGLYFVKYQGGNGAILTTKIIKN
jgi:hypothetical protein